MVPRKNYSVNMITKDFRRICHKLSCIIENGSNQSMKPTTPHNNMTRMKKSEDTPVDAPSPTARRVPTETGFKLRVALPSSQQSKGYASVNFEWTLLLPTERSEWGASSDMKR